MKNLSLGLAFVFTAFLLTGCTDTGAGGGGAGGGGAVTIAIGAVGNCPGGKIWIASGPTATPAGTGSMQLKMTVCVQCPDATGTLVGVVGAPVDGVLSDDSITFPDSLTAVTGTTGATGCVTLTKRVAQTLYDRIMGKNFRILFTDTAGVTLGRTSVLIP